VPSRRARDAEACFVTAVVRQLSRICVEEIGVALRLLGAVSALLSAVESRA